MTRPEPDLTQRGPDYAHDLSPAERATLDRLLTRVPARRHRAVTAPVAAGLAVLFVLAIASVLTIVPRPPAPRPEQVGASVSTSVLLDQLAAAAAGHADPMIQSPGHEPTPDGRPTAIGPSRLEITVYRSGDRCRARAVEVITGISGHPTWPEALMGRATLSWVSPPAPAYDVAGCSPPAMAEDKGAEDKGAEDKGAEDKGAEDKGAEDKGPSLLADTGAYGPALLKAWAVMTVQVPDAAGLPPYPDPRALDGVIPIDAIPADPGLVTNVLDKLTSGPSVAAGEPGETVDGPAKAGVWPPDADPAARAVWTEARWWTLWIEFMTSPLISADQRAAALRAAAVKAATASTEAPRRDVADVSGRRAVSFQTPFLRRGAVVAATLSLDPDTGVLLQRAVSALDSGIPTYVITVFDR